MLQNSASAQTVSLSKVTVGWVRDVDRRECASPEGKRILWPLAAEAVLDGRSGDALATLQGRDGFDTLQGQDALATYKGTMRSLLPSPRRLGDLFVFGYESEYESFDGGGGFWGQAALFLGLVFIGVLEAFEYIGGSSCVDAFDAVHDGAEAVQYEIDGVIEVGVERYAFCGVFICDG